MEPIRPWMTFVLRFAGVFNTLAGFGMVCFYHEGYELLRIAKPEQVLPVQVTGVLVALFGIGYLLVAGNPTGNRNILTLGFLAKGICGSIALVHVAIGNFPWWFGVVVFFADIIYLPPFLIIILHLYRPPCKENASA